MRKWVLPEYIEDILPDEARRIERLRRALLDLFEVHGYQLVQPPLLEYVESLLTGTGHDLDLRTFKLVDQLSGRTLGVRADITPQVARIDAHLLNRRGVSRLCYAGSVLHTLPAGLNRTREPLQAGAEIYGHAGIEADVEVQRLMLAALRLAGIARPQLDIGHVGVFRALVRRARADADTETALFRAVQLKDAAALRTLAGGFSAKIRAAFEQLPELTGGADVLRAAQRRLPDDPAIGKALTQLRSIGGMLRTDGIDVRFDLGELRGYHYHSGVVFAAYIEGAPNALALGGRYDEVGRAFGRARPATGFSLDLRELAAAAPAGNPRSGVLAPYSPHDAALQRRIAALRRAGTVVVVALPGRAVARTEHDCDRKLVRRAGKWQVVKI
ncbi:MAG TPA: ATP phosphoribosyltransferase regulatory subunit [Burkholderiales bacterium]|nr:ATP phosphoribosyltransferase regulatory subunit [Burkholderiales bacterium]